MNYKPDVDIMDLITLEDAMEAYELGPNGGALHCLCTLIFRFAILFGVFREEYRVV